MSQIIRIKNNTTVDKTWVGQTILAGAYHELTSVEIGAWKNDKAVFLAIGTGDIVVNKGGDTIDDILNSADAWKWLLGNTMPLSELGNKLAIHSSTKPAKSGKDFYLIWTGAGDDVTGSPVTIGNGDLLQFSLSAGTSKKSIEAHFSPAFGDIYIHEGYAKWEGGGLGDFLEADVISPPTALQTVANLDLEISNNWVKYAVGGPGTGTHGFAANPSLIKRSKSLDGDWDYDTINGLLPNLSGTGLYKISDIERIVHHYFNKIPTLGSSYGYTILTSDESAWLPPGYFLRITANNVSDTTWTACIFMEVFREQSAVP